MWLLIPLPHPRRRHFQDQEPAFPAGDVHDEDDVDGLLDEISPPVSDLDERILEDPTMLTMAILRLLGRARSWEEAAVLATLIMPRFEGGDDDAYRNGGFGAVPASAAAVAELKKGTFRAGGDGDGTDAADGCAICLEEFEDGEEVTVMPCDHGHEFHPDCITEWLGCSNMCPLCRHPLPTASCGDDNWEEAAVLAALIMPGFGGGDDAYRNGGFGAVPASAAAVAELKKRTFRAGGGDGHGAAADDGCCGAAAASQGVPAWRSLKTARRSP
ncbi:hypothetical protein EJB05_29519, partial [Eragrostis curvula]